jgi:hypothetical protein
MRTIRITGIDKHLYEVIKELAVEGNRSVEQQVLFMIKDYISKRHLLSKTKTSAQVLLELSGTWEDERMAKEIVQDIKKSRRNSRSLLEGL